MKFSIKNFFSKCDQNRSFLPIFSDIFCAVINSKHKIENMKYVWIFLLRSVECRIVKSVFVSLSRTWLNRLKTRAAELNFIHFSLRFVEANIFQWIGIYICLCIKSLLQMKQLTFISANWDFSFFLSFWSSFLIFASFPHVFATIYHLTKWNDDSNAI